MWKRNVFLETNLHSAESAIYSRIKCRFSFEWKHSKELNNSTRPDSVIDDEEELEEEDTDVGRVQDGLVDALPSNSFKVY